MTTTRTFFPIYSGVRRYSELSAPVMSCSRSRFHCTAPLIGIGDRPRTGPRAVSSAQRAKVPSSPQMLGSVVSPGAPLPSLVTVAPLTSTWERSTLVPMRKVPLVV